MGVHGYVCINTDPQNPLAEKCQLSCIVLPNSRGKILTTYFKNPEYISHTPGVPPIYLLIKYPHSTKTRISHNAFLDVCNNFNAFLKSISKFQHHLSLKYKER